MRISPLYLAAALLAASPLPSLAAGWASPPPGPAPLENPVMTMLNPEVYYDNQPVQVLEGPDTFMPTRNQHYAI